MAAIEYSERAVAWLEDADATAQKQILSKLEEVRDSAFPEHFLKPLSGEDLYRIRAGDYRAIVAWQPDDQTLFVREIGHRRNIYD